MFKVNIYWTYVLRSNKDKNFYIGFTSDLKKRLSKHKTGNVSSTKSRRPLVLIHCELFLSKHDALRREKYLKTTQGQKGLKLILRDYLKL